MKVCHICKWAKSDDVVLFVPGYYFLCTTCFQHATGTYRHPNVIDRETTEIRNQQRELEDARKKLKDIDDILSGAIASSHTAEITKLKEELTLVTKERDEWEQRHKDQRVEIAELRGSVVIHAPKAYQVNTDRPIGFTIGFIPTGRYITYNEFSIEGDDGSNRLFIVRGRVMLSKTLPEHELVHGMAIHGMAIWRNIDDYLDWYAAIF